MPSGACDIALITPATSIDKHSAGWDIFWMNAGDMITVCQSPHTPSISTLIIRAKLKGVLFHSLLSRSRPSGSQEAVESQSSAQTPIDRGYRYADVLREYAESLHTLTTPIQGNHLDWNIIKSPTAGGCHSIRVGIEQKALKHLRKFGKSGNESTGEATSRAIQLGEKGIEVC